MLEVLPLPSAHDGAVWSHAWAGQYPFKHRHDELELNLITRGHGLYLVDDRTYRVGPGSMLWLFPGQTHLLIDGSSDFAMWIEVFRPRLVRRLTSATPRRILREASPAGDFCRQLAPGPRQKLERLLRDLAGRKDDPAYLNAGLAFTLLEAWDDFQKADAAIIGEDVHPAVRRAAALLRKSPDNADLATLACQAGLSRTRLSEVFRQQTGMTLVDFRNRVRLERFFALQASSSGKTRLALALEAGFGSYQQFHRVHQQHRARATA